MSWNLKDSNIERLKGTMWIDRNGACGDRLSISKIETINGKHIEEHYSVILEYEDWIETRKAGIDFLDYIALDRYIPNNEEAEEVSNIVYNDDKYPTVIDN